MQRGMNQLYPTPVLYDVMDSDIQQTIVDGLLQHPELRLTHALAGTQADIFKHDHEFLQKFATELVEPVFDRYLRETMNSGLADFPYSFYSGWQLGYAGMYNMPMHNHRNSHVTSVFYFLTEPASLGGDMVLVDPRHNANRGCHEKQTPWFDYTVHQPTSGDYLVFPSFLYHFVRPHTGDLRLGIAVDLFLED